MPSFTNQDAEVDQLVTDLAALQTTYEAANSKYWQGINTNALPVDDGTNTPDLNKKASDHTSWSVFGVSMPANCYCCLAVHAYDGPQGKGYVVEGQCRKSGVDYYRVAHAVGPETGRDTGGWVTLTI